MRAAAGVVCLVLACSSSLLAWGVDVHRLITRRALVPIRR